LETIEFLFRNLGIEEGMVKETDLFLRNFIYTTIVIRKDLLEISERQRCIEKRMKKEVDHSTYYYKKLDYFRKINQEAKEEIIKYICYGQKEYVNGIRIKYNDLIDKDAESKMWIYGRIYDYRINSRFYDPEYDFSTCVKFYNIPDVKPLDFMSNIEEKIDLKNMSLEDYNKEIIRIVDENNMVSNMKVRVASNYHIHERQEIFETMEVLFDEKKYLAFVTMAAIQLEGIFNDLVGIRFGRKENQGTLVEKVNKAFKDDTYLKLILYPYFAFDIPNLRNTIAHKGIVEVQDIRQTAYNLVLDLNCILYLTERASTDKFNKFIKIYKKLIGKEENKEIADVIANELYISKEIFYEFFWELLLNPEVYKEELDYYIPDDLDEDEVCLKDIVCFISDQVKGEAFWDVILETCEAYLSGDRIPDRELISFIEEMKKRYMGILEGVAKRKCCQVNVKLMEIKRKVTDR